MEEINIYSLVKTKNDIDLAITKSIESGLILMNQIEMVQKTIQDIFNHKELEDCFSEVHEVLNEQTIIQKEGKMIKPDRVVILNGGDVILLDYKTGVHYSKYQLQLENYQKDIEKMCFKVFDICSKFIKI